MKGIIRVVNRSMKPFLKLFGVEEGNGLLLFAGDINTPEELLSLVKDFFRPRKRDQ